MKIVDAVKGPFYPTPPPYPTFLLKEGQALPTEPLFAPILEVDPLVPKPPEEQLQ